MLLRFTLFVTHYIIYLRSLLWSWLMTYSKPLALLFHHQPLAQIQSDGKALKKLPLHIGILVVEDEISFSDLANVILWCMAMGISYISIYDRNGICKRQKEDIEANVRKQQKKILGNDNHKNVAWHIGLCNESEAQDSSLDRTKVLLLDRNDGMPSIVSIARSMASAVKRKELYINDITPDIVDQQLQGLQGFPDPDMILRFGVVNSMLGYLPWQIRLSEIMSLPSHHKIDYNTFHDTLLGYSNTQQRFGK